MIGLFLGSPSHSAMSSLNLFSCSAKAYKIIGYKFVEKHLSYHHTLKIIGYILYINLSTNSYHFSCFASPSFQENTRKEDQKLKLKPEAIHHSSGRLKIYLSIRDTV